MITDTFFVIFSWILDLIHNLFNVISFVIPPQIPQAFNTFFSYVRIGDGLIPFLSTAMLAIFTVVEVWVLLYVIKIVLFAFSAIPWFGKVLNLPNHNMNYTNNGAVYKIDDKGNETVTKYSRTRRWDK